MKEMKKLVIALLALLLLSGCVTRQEEVKNEPIYLDIKLEDCQMVDEVNLKCELVIICNGEESGRQPIIWKEFFEK